MVILIYPKDKHNKKEKADYKKTGTKIYQNGKEKGMDLKKQEKTNALPKDVKQMLRQQAYEFLLPAQQYVDIKFNETAIMAGVKEDNPYALRLYHEVFESKIEQKKTRGKKLK